MISVLVQLPYDYLDTDKQSKLNIIRRMKTILTGSVIFVTKCAPLDTLWMEVRKF